MNASSLSLFFALGTLASFGACHPPTLASKADSSARDDASKPLQVLRPATLAPESLSDAGDADSAADAQPGTPQSESTLLDFDEDPMALHKETKQELLSLFEIHPSERERTRGNPEAFLNLVFGTDSPRTASQGNKEIALHTISKRKCMEGLRDIVLQTPEQRRICGADFMVPIHAPGSAAKYCVDIFEFPNKPCELPVVWIPPVYAKHVCELQGKRLCTQPEWQESCRADPAGGPDQRYAYGDKLDVTICHTNRGHRQGCDASWSDKAWKSCTTDTEPSGSFPQCRSRFGVFDQSGNVAEIMTRNEGGTAFTQLKGSAWFYKEVQREVGQPAPKGTLGETYPDHCNFDPRWHVEPANSGGHVNYHLGFRCCKDAERETLTTATDAGARDAGPNDAGATDASNGAVSSDR
jgi:formylglycine-generating enzyme